MRQHPQLIATPEFIDLKCPVNVRPKPFSIVLKTNQVKV